jgi:hypothetical protein
MARRIRPRPSCARRTGLAQSSGQALDDGYLAVLPTSPQGVRIVATVLHHAHQAVEHDVLRTAAGISDRGSRVTP